MATFTRKRPVTLHRRLPLLRSTSIQSGNRVRAARTTTAALGGPRLVPVRLNAWKAPVVPPCLGTGAAAPSRLRAGCSLRLATPGGSAACPPGARRLGVLPRTTTTTTTTTTAAPPHDGSASCLARRRRRRRRRRRGQAGGRYRAPPRVRAGPGGPAARPACSIASPRLPPPHDDDDDDDDDDGGSAARRLGLLPRTPSARGQRKAGGGGGKTDTRA